LAQRDPRIVVVDINANECLNIGIGGPWAFVEHVVMEPCKAEVATTREIGTEKPRSLRFLSCGALDTEVLAESLMPVSEAIEVVAGIFRSGALPDNVHWALS
jgi:hypothetical protein